MLGMSDEALKGRILMNESLAGVVESPERILRMAGAQQHDRVAKRVPSGQRDFVSEK